MRPGNPLSTKLRRWREVNSRPYRETLQTTGFYVGRVLIVTREFASIPSPPPRCRSLRDYHKFPVCVFQGMRNLSVRCHHTPVKTGARRPPPVGRPRAPAKGRDGRSAPRSSSAMSSGRLFLDRVARQQSPSPLHRQPDHKTLDESEKRNYHRTVTASFPSCLTRGVHPTYLR